MEEEAAEELERESGIEDVLNEDDVLIAHGLIDIFIEPDFAARLLAAAVTGNTNEVEGGIELNLPCEIAEENGRAFEHADEDDRLSRIIAGNLSCHFGDTIADLITRDQYRQSS